MGNVAIIGAGPSGLAAAKAVLEQGLTPVLFEASGETGGMWASPGRGAWSSLGRTNLSYHSCAFSDFPWPAGTDVFPQRSEVGRYLTAYAEAFGLTPHIRFGTRVLAVRRDDDAGWRVAARTSGGAMESRSFPHVIVASGFFARPHTPPFPGLSSYRGQIFHSADCDSPVVMGHRFHGLRVLVVGAAFSGTEIASQLIQYADEVIVTFRNPMWFVPRWAQALPRGRRHPLDLVMYSRWADLPVKRDPVRFLSRVAGDPGRVSAELAFDPGREPPATIAITDEFLSQIGAGLLSVKRSSGITFDATGVRFADGSRRDVDAVVMCTGYTATLPFFDSDLLDILAFHAGDQFQPLLLHRDMFHPALPGLFFVGQYRGPYFPVMELQARWIAGIAAGLMPPPSDAEMAEGIAVSRRLRHKQPRPQFPHGDFVDLADGLARTIGVYPHLDARHPLRDHVERGPVIPAHYRILGPHAAPDLAETLIRAAPAPYLETMESHADINFFPG